ncbi:MAG: hypothetical protein Q4F67_01670 [Propionibacteriaceae bacterium]|nr:hypothetical protein [Propionibacteriaceae bacterium]
MRRPFSLAAAGVALVALLSACAGGDPVQPSPPETPGGAAAGGATSDAAQVAALAEKANAESVHQVTLGSTGLGVLVWTGSAVEFWVDQGGQQQTIPITMPEGQQLFPGKPAVDFPLGDVAAAREAAGCTEPVIAVNLLPSGVPVTVARCNQPDDPRAAITDGVANEAPEDFYGRDYLAKQLEFAAQASPDGRVRAVALAVDQLPAGRVTSADTTGYDTADGQRCEVPSVAMPLVGRNLTGAQGMLCGTEAEADQEGHGAPFDPASVDAERLAAAVADVREQLGDDLTVLTVTDVDGTLTLKAMNQQIRPAQIPLA